MIGKDQKQLERTFELSRLLSSFYEIKARRVKTFFHYIYFIIFNGKRFIIHCCYLKKINEHCISIRGYFLWNRLSIIILHEYAFCWGKLEINKLFSIKYELYLILSNCEKCNKTTFSTVQLHAFNSFRCCFLTSKEGFQRV